MTPHLKNAPTALSAAIALAYLLFAVLMTAYSWFYGLFIGYFSGLAGATSFLLWLFLNEDRIKSTSAVFFPPENITPFDAAYIMDGKCTDIAPLIVYWANKGYIRISEAAKNNKKSFLIHKLRDVDGNSRSYEKELFDEMFCWGSDDQITSAQAAAFSAYQLSKEVTRERLSSFYNNDFRVFSKWPSARALLIGAPTLACMWWMMFTRFGSFDASLFFTALFIVPLTAIRINLTSKIGAEAAKILFTCVLLLFSGLYAALLERTSLLSLWFILEMLDIFIPVNLMLSCRHRTKLGFNCLAQLTNFKTTIETIDSARLSQLIDMNPNYFYEALPYAMVLGVADELARKCDVARYIRLQLPAWYEGGTANGTFSAARFASELAEGLR